MPQSTSLPAGSTDVEPTDGALAGAGVLDVLEARGFVKQCTDLDALRAHLAAGPVTFYVGFDPTGDSLHVGHLLPIMAMSWLQRAGHRPVIVHGGGTAMVGDPSGKTKTRDMITPEQIRDNLAGQRPQFSRFLDVGEGSDQALLFDNADWLLSLNYVRFLREVGRHFSVNRMLTAEGAQQRLERNQGLSFIEFNYHLLQSYDFLHLHRAVGCTLQLGGNDQWFNILGGIDLIRRETGGESHGLTVPLILTADGKKMGKTEAGAVFLDADKVSPFAYYQYWINVQDADVARFLKLYTWLPLDRIAELEALQGARVREAKAVLAYEATRMAHGQAAADDARAAAKAMFGGGSQAAAAPTHATQFPVTVLDALVGSGLAASKGAARRLIKQGGVKVEVDGRKVKVDSPEQSIEGPTVLWKGKKSPLQLVEG
jgi:tyrosyl-tRNA synthetase